MYKHLKTEIPTCILNEMVGIGIYKPKLAKCVMHETKEEEGKVTILIILFANRFVPTIGVACIGKIVEVGEFFPLLVFINTENTQPEHSTRYCYNSGFSVSGFSTFINQEYLTIFRLI